MRRRTEIPWRSIDRSQGKPDYWEPPFKNEWIGAKYTDVVSDGWDYRVIYAIGRPGNYVIRSRVDTSSRPGRLNIVLNVENRILDVFYY